MNGEGVRVALKSIRRVVLALLGAGLLVVSILAVGFGGPVVLGFYLWLLAVLGAIWLLVRTRLSLETYALAVMGTSTVLLLLVSAMGPVVVSTLRSSAGAWLLLGLFILPVALWLWIGVRKAKGR